MSSPWAPVGPVASLDGRRATLVEGSSFCLSDMVGDIHPGLPQGLFVLDTRTLSRWQLEVNGVPMEELAVERATPHSATFVGRTRPTAGQADSDVLVFRARHVGQGMREVITLRNYGASTQEVTVEMAIDADFADLFEVKEQRVRRRGAFRSEYDERVLSLGHRLDEGDRRGVEKEVTIAFDRDAVAATGLASWQVVLPARGEWSVCCTISLGVGGARVEPRFRCGEPDRSPEPQLRADRWQAATSALTTDDARLSLAVTKAIADLGGLRIHDPQHPDATVIAAGAPWFMTLFGRDSLLTAWMTLPVDPTLAVGVLDTLARLQGTKINADTEEQPGRILHEVRFGKATSLHLGGGHVYFGTADATPLFVMLLGELRRWGLADAALQRLLPHADRALDWIRGFGDADGDGYVEYLRATPQGLQNQGWKDSWDGVTFADGTVAVAPIALAEVQGYTYAAYRARSELAAAAGDDPGAQIWDERARDLRVAFNRDFWLPDRGWYALALDADKRPVDALASNMGHLLWTGIVDPERAGAVADLLLSPELFSGWGIRTLATNMVAYNPVSYHNGSVWPHDSAIAAAGLMRYGFTEHAWRVMSGLLDAASQFEGRLPELFAGIARDELGVPASYPTSCSPQAWASSSPLLMLRSLLRFDPLVPEGRIHLAPVPPAGMHRLAFTASLADERHLQVQFKDGEWAVDGLDGLEVESTPLLP